MESDHQQSLIVLLERYIKKAGIVRCPPNPNNQTSPVFPPKRTPNQTLADPGGMHWCLGSKDEIGLLGKWTAVGWRFFKKDFDSYRALAPDETLHAF